MNVKSIGMQSFNHRAWRTFAIVQRAVLRPKKRRPRPRAKRPANVERKTRRRWRRRRLLLPRPEAMSRRRPFANRPDWPETNGVGGGGGEKQNCAYLFFRTLHLRSFSLRSFGGYFHFVTIAPPNFWSLWILLSSFPACLFLRRRVQWSLCLLLWLHPSPSHSLRRNEWPHDYPFSVIRFF